MRDSTYRLLAEDYASELDDLESLFPEEDDLDWGEAVIQRPMAKHLGATPFVQRPPTPFRPSPALSGAPIAPSAARPGGGQVRFERPVATAQAIEQLKADTSKAIAEVRAEARTNLGRLDDRLNTTNTKVDALGRTVKSSAGRVGALEQRSQLFALLPFIQGKPKPATIKFTDDAKAKTVESVTYADKNDMLLPLILMGGLGGGSGSGGGGFGGDNMALLAIAFMDKD